MKIIGLLMMPAGWLIVLSALILLRTSLAQSLFVVAGVGIEILGLVLITLAHLEIKGGNR